MAELGTIYIFFRQEGWYPILLSDDDDACRNARVNPGTIRVEDVSGRIIWSDPSVVEQKESTG